MIEINKRFSIERESDCWVLYDKQPSTHKKSKDGFALKKSFYPRLHHVVDEIFDRVPMGCESLKEVVDRMNLLKSHVYRAINGGALQ